MVDDLACCGAGVIAETAGGAGEDECTEIAAEISWSC